MKHLMAALVCLVTLYAVDAYFCDGRYFGTAAQVIENAYASDWW
jgi:hypothetical protein